MASQCSDDWSLQVERTTLLFFVCNLPTWARSNGIGLQRITQTRIILLESNLHTEFFAQKEMKYAEGINSTCTILESCVSSMEVSVISISRPGNNEKQDLIACYSMLQIPYYQITRSSEIKVRRIRLNPNSMVTSMAERIDANGTSMKQMMHIIDRLEAKRT